MSGGPGVRPARSSLAAAIGLMLLNATLVLPAPEAFATPEPASAEPVEEIALQSAEQVRALCLALRPAARVRFRGDPVAQAKARAAHEAERQRLRRSRFVLELPWSGFVVEAWDPERSTVAIGTDRPFRAWGGDATFFDLDRGAIELRSVAGANDLLRAGLSRGELRLELRFAVAREENPCALGQGRRVALSVGLTSAALLSDERVVAHDP